MTADNETIESELFIEAIFKKYGYDFRNYSRASLNRRIKSIWNRCGLKTISEMQHRILYDKSFFESVLLDLTINVTEMFRDPSFYCAVRQKVLPILRTYPFFKIWHAGCSTGEEVYSMAILLKEENLLENAMLYATDIDDRVLKTAREGIYPLDRIKEYTMNYQKSCGKGTFSDYYTAKFEAAIMQKNLKKNIVFSQHNLVTDGVFGEMNLIVCRNVIIYFDKDLQGRVFNLFHESLIRKGILCLGSKETVKFSNMKDSFQEFDAKEKIYRKVS